MNTPAIQPTIHHPRPAIVCAVEGCNDQRRFGADLPLRSNYGVEVEVLRLASYDTACVRFENGHHWRAAMIATAAELREMAARLIDAAHDIETFPAAALAGGAA